MTRRSDGIRWLLLAALVSTVGVLALHPMAARLTDVRPAIITSDASAPERSGVSTCWLHPVLGAIIERVPDPFTRLQLWQRARQWLPSVRCCTAPAADLHLPHYTGRVTIPGACGARR
jgi:hypothetical protein